MPSQHQGMLEKAYAAFNRRDIDAVLEVFHPDVQWANGWEGGSVKGYEEVRNYWIRQWKEVDPNVEPVAFNERQNGTVEVDVHQVAKDRQGNVLFDGMVKHIYTIENDLILKMEIEKS